jgi:UDP-N-acetylmuramoyl-L-alanyl-D-glutamate--2,6-diaminopimelate ligase
MHKISKLLAGLKVNKIIGPDDISIKNVVIDSRDIEEYDMFVALNGVSINSHKYIDNVIDNGCVAIVCSETPLNICQGITYIIVDDTSYALGIIAANLYDHPSKKLNLVGVTGTNGKTTTVYFMYQLFSKLGYKVGMISTLYNIVTTSIVHRSTLTTPDPLTLNSLLSDMVAQGCTYCFMEVSSHGADQNRIIGLHFAGGVFMNLTHDHLDYHKTFNNYINAKKKFFDYLPATAFALSNIDDKHANILVQNTAARKYTFGIHNVADFNARFAGQSIHGLDVYVEDMSLYFSFLGKFNTYNILAAYAVSQIFGLDKDKVFVNLATLVLPKGRFQIINFNHIFYGVVDYAHTPDALEKILQSLIEIKSPNSKLILVMGCGGNRDQSKRPIMGKIASNMSDLTIFTADNPRNEAPEKIISDMSKNLTKDENEQILHIVDRDYAINTAISLAAKGDIVAVVGKGHENYQEIQGVKHPFNDFEILKAAGFEKLRKS